MSEAYISNSLSSQIVRLYMIIGKKRSSGYCYCIEKMREIRFNLELTISKFNFDVPLSLVIPFTLIHITPIVISTHLRWTCLNHCSIFFPILFGIDATSTVPQRFSFSVLHLSKSYYISISTFLFQIRSSHSHICIYVASYKPNTLWHRTRLRILW